MSPFGQRLKNRDNFRIVSDMNRTNEFPAETADARFIKRVRELGFLHKCSVFTCTKETAPKELKKILSKSENVDVYATVRVYSLLQFICSQN
jgi:imidazolonepropionase-like amidohydrolase